MNIKEVLASIANKIFQDREEENVTVFSNQRIVDKAEKAFMKVLEQRSMDDQMLYDCNFMIAVPTEHYDVVSVAAPLIAKTIVRRFYKVIKSNLKKRPNYTPISSYWNFEFISKEIIGDLEDSGIEIISQLTTEESWSDTLSNKDSIGKISLNGKHSNYSRWNINPDVLKNIDILERGKVRIPFNKELEFVENSTNFSHQRPQSSAPSQASNPPVEELAKLYFDENGKRMEFPMRRVMIWIGRALSGDDKATYEKLFIQTQNTSLRHEHFYIRYEQRENRFYIATFAPTIVNSELMQVSSSREHLVWIPLKQYSRIECGTYKIEFKALK